MFEVDKKFKQLFILGLGLLLLSGGSAVGYFYLSRQAPPADVQFPPTPVSQPTPVTTPETVPTTPAVEKGVAEGRVFYAKDENIFSYDVETKETEQWTNYPSDQDPSPRDVTVVDENTLGFSRCDIVVGESHCGLYLLDLKTKKITPKVELDKGYFSKSGWFSKDRFAYLAVADNRWRLYLIDGSDTKLLVDLDLNVYGRGGFVEDSSEIKFSPDGSRLFHISTGSPRSAFDLTTHIYDASTGAELVVLENSTQPEWLDNQRIIFRKYDADASSENGLYVYTLGSGAETKFVGTATTAYHPELLSGTNRVLYEDGASRQIWLYNLSLEKNTLVVENALFGFWLSPTQIVYDNVTSCGDNCGMFDYDVASVDIYDLSLGQKTDSILGLEDAYGAGSLYR